jgi:single-stranded-DNA-specific exonuclease
MAEPPPALSLFDESFHEGVVGIVAGRLKDQLYRPAFVFARSSDGSLKGSGRSIAGFHLRDALDLVSKRVPGVLRRFGGHAMAAGATLEPDGFTLFDEALRTVAAEWLDPTTLQRRLMHDGPLPAAWFNAETVALMDAQVWGQGFEAPLFRDRVEVLQQTLLKERHLKLRLRHAGLVREAIWFQRTEPLPAEVVLAYRVQIDTWNGAQRVQMMVEAMEAEDT